MDEKQAREKLGKLDREIGDYTLKLRSTESRLSCEHESLRKLVSQRTAMVARLADANTEEAQKINKSLDEFEDQIRSTERRTESLQASLKAIRATMEELNGERAKLSEAIAAEVNAKEFAAGRVRIEQRFAALHEVLVTARAMMAELNTDAASFGQRFAAPAYTAIAPLFDEFLTTEHNLDQRGFRFAHGYRQDFRVVLNPMTPR